MYKSLLMVSLFALSASAMDKKDSAPAMPKNSSVSSISKTDVAAIALATASLTSCTVATMCNPAIGIPCFLKAASVYGAVHALGMAHEMSKDLNFKKELDKKQITKTESNK